VRPSPILQPRQEGAGGNPGQGLFSPPKLSVQWMRVRRAMPELGREIAFGRPELQGSRKSTSFFDWKAIAPCLNVPFLNGGFMAESFQETYQSHPYLDPNKISVSIVTHKRLIIIILNLHSSRMKTSSISCGGTSLDLD
jgi:hypothetical protein